MNKEILTAVGSTLLSIGKSDDFKEFMCGTYSDGSPRSVTDAINNEVLSPKQKKKALDAKEKRKKKKKNKKKTKKLKL